jgi:hypothetical protein
MAYGILFPDIYINEFGSGNGHVRNFELMMRETAHPVGRVCHAIINKSTAYLEGFYHFGNVVWEEMTTPISREGLDNPLKPAFNWYELMSNLGFQRATKGSNPTRQFLPLICNYLAFYRRVYIDLVSQGKKEMTFYFDFSPIAKLAAWLFRNSFPKDNPAKLKIKVLDWGAPFCNPPDSPILLTFNGLIYEESDVPPLAHRIELAEVVREEVLKEILFYVKFDTEALLLERFNDPEFDPLTVFNADEQIILGPGELDCYSCQQLFVPRKNFYIRQTTSFPNYRDRREHGGAVKVYGYLDLSQVKLVKALMDTDFVFQGNVVVPGLKKDQILKRGKSQITLKSNLFTYLEELHQLSYANIIITQPGSGMLHNVFGLDTKVILAAPKYMEQAINATLFVKLYPTDQVISQFHESEEINAKRLEAFLKE